MLRILGRLCAVLLIPLSVVPSPPAHAAGPHLITVIAQGAGNAPISGMQVGLYYGGNSADPPAAGAYSLVETASTDANGWASFLDKPDGYYKVRYAGNATYAPHWWDNGTSLEDADWFGAGELDPNPTIGPVTLDQKGTFQGGVVDQFGSPLPLPCTFTSTPAGQVWYDEGQLRGTDLAPGSYAVAIECPGGATGSVEFVVGRTSQGGNNAPTAPNKTLAIAYSYGEGAEIVVPSGGLDTLPQAVTGNPGTWPVQPYRFDYIWTIGGVKTVSAYFGKTLVEADRGKTLTFKACAFLAQETVCSPTQELVVPGSPPPAGPVNTGPPSITGVAKVGSTLTASTGSWDTPGLTFAYAWRLNGAATGATGSAYVVPPGAQDKAVSVLVTATASGGGSSSAVSAPTSVVVPGTLVVDAAPRLAGSARPGRRLTVTPGRTSPASPATYAWFVGSTPVAGATGPSLKLRKKYLGKRIRVLVRHSLPGYAVREISLVSAKVKA